MQAAYSLTAANFGFDFKSGAFSKSFHEPRFMDSVARESSMLHILVTLTMINALDLQNVGL